jgi:hypothetical protein
VKLEGICAQPCVPPFPFNFYSEAQPVPRELYTIMWNLLKYVGLSWMPLASLSNNILTIHLLEENKKKNFLSSNNAFSSS